MLYRGCRIPTICSLYSVPRHLNLGGGSAQLTCNSNPEKSTLRTFAIETAAFKPTGDLYEKPKTIKKKKKKKKNATRHLVVCKSFQQLSFRWMHGKPAAKPLWIEGRARD